jgi:hypothetical protein
MRRDVVRIPQRSSGSNQVAKFPDSDQVPGRALLLRDHSGRNWRKQMKEKTCAACDCPLDETAIAVTVGGESVEVCCNECARALNEAGATVSGEG